MEVKDLTPSPFPKGKGGEIVDLDEVSQEEVLIRQLAARCEVQWLNLYGMGMCAAVVLPGFVWVEGRLKKKDEG